MLAWDLPTKGDAASLRLAGLAEAAIPTWFVLLSVNLDFFQGSSVLSCENSLSSLF
jgi:hypothetical protein